MVPEARRGLCHECYSSGVDTQHHPKASKSLCEKCWRRYNESVNQRRTEEGPAW